MAAISEWATVIGHDAELRGRRVVVMGLGRFGGQIGVTRFLVARGADVLVTDLADAATLGQSVAALAGLPVTYRLGGHDESDLDHADLVVVSPAVDRARSAFFQAAAERAIPWTTEIDLFLARCPARVIGITGSVGKSTICAMLHAVLDSPAGRSSAGIRQAYLGGNIGRSLLESTGEMSNRDTVVLELSSFQLEAMAPNQTGPQVACLTNVMPHHLQRHGTFENYLDAKLNLFRRQPPGGTAVVGSDNRDVQQRVRELAVQRGCRLVEAWQAPEDYVLRVPGRHNQFNAHLAARMAAAVGVADDAIRAALAAFSGLPHRLQLVAEIAGVRYYNDSKATSPEAVRTALAAIDAPVVLLCGGKDIGDELDKMAGCPSPNVRTVLCFGEAGPRLAGLIREGHAGSAPPAVGCAARLTDAVTAARAAARAGDVVLLSPGCPSYDEFVNYEHRGDVFAAAVSAG